MTTEAPFWIAGPNSSRPDADVHTLTVGREPVKLPPIATGEAFLVRHNAPQSTQLIVKLICPDDPGTRAPGGAERLCPAGETEFSPRVMRKPNGGDHYIAFIRAGAGPVTLAVEVQTR